MILLDKILDTFYVVSGLVVVGTCDTVFDEKTLKSMTNGAARLSYQEHTMQVVIINAQQSSQPSRYIFTLRAPNLLAFQTLVGGTLELLPTTTSKWQKFKLWLGRPMPHPIADNRRRKRWRFHQL